MKYLIVLLALTSMAVAGDRYSMRVISQGKGKGYMIRPEIYKGGSKAATYWIHVYTGSTKVVMKCTKLAVSKGATYKPVSVITKAKGVYGVVIFKGGKQVYSKLKGSAIKAAVKKEECGHGGK